MIRSAALLALFFINLSAFAQRVIDEDTGPSFKDRIFYGGGLGMNGGRDYLGNRYFYVQVTPVVGYMITPNLSSGLGIDYTYLRYSDFDVSTSQYGLSPFVRYNIQQFFGQVEYQMLSVEQNPFGEGGGREIYDRLLGGVGITQPLGARGAINMLAMYDFIYKNRGPFASPWVFRVFFSY